jgi:PAS domain-containing protein
MTVGPIPCQIGEDTAPGVAGATGGLRCVVNSPSGIAIHRLRELSTHPLPLVVGAVFAGTQMTLPADAVRLRRPKWASVIVRMARCVDLTAGLKPRSPTETNEDLVSLAAMVESCTDATISADVGWAVTSWNPAAKRLCEYSAEGAIGQPTSFIGPIDRPGEFAALRAPTTVVVKAIENCWFSVAQLPSC